MPADRIDLDTAPRPHGALALVEVDGETVVYDETTGALHLLDGVATIIWRCLDGRTLREAAGELSVAFGAKRELVERDVLALARRLGAQGLLDGVDGNPSVLAGAATPSAGDPCGG